MYRMTPLKVKVLVLSGFVAAILSGCISVRYSPCHPLPLPDDGGPGMRRCSPTLEIDTYDPNVGVDSYGAAYVGFDGSNVGISSPGTEIVISANRSDGSVSTQSFGITGVGQRAYLAAPATVKSWLDSQHSQSPIVGVSYSLTDVTVSNIYGDNVFNASLVTPSQGVVASASASWRAGGGGVRTQY